MAGGFYSAICSTPFTGTASDPGSNATGVSTVTLTLQDLTGSFTVFSSSAAGGTPANWTYTPSNTYIANHQYQLTATAIDNAGNSNNTSALFTYDVQTPTSTITNPAPGFITSWTTISGKANDQLSSHPSGISTTACPVAVQQAGGTGTALSTFGGSNPQILPPPLLSALLRERGAIRCLPHCKARSLPAAPTSSFRFPRPISPPIRNSDPWPPISQPVAGVTVVYDTVAPTAVINVPVLASTSGVISLSITSGGLASGDVFPISKSPSKIWSMVFGWTILSDSP